MNDELKPCPFCGRMPNVIPLEHYKEFFISCKSQNCIEQKHLYKSKRSAIKAWNRRVVC